MKLSHRRALLWSFAERYASFVLTLASTLVLSRVLTPAQVGMFSLCAALLAVATIVRDMGVSEYLIQARELTRDRLRAASALALLAAWTLAVLIWLLRPALARWFDEPMVAQVLAVMALHFVLLPLTSPAFALLNRELAFRRIFWLQSANAIVAAATAVVLALRGHGTLALAWGPVTGVLTQTLLIGWLAPRGSFVLPGLGALRQHGSEMLRFGLTYMGSRLIETLARNVHEPVIARRFDFEAVGLFSRAQGLVEMFHTHVADAVVRVSTPAFAAAHRAGQPLDKAFAQATALFVSVSWPFFGFVALCSAEIIAILFGPQWHAAAPLASILAVAAMPAGLVEMVPQMLSATGHVQRRLRLALWVAPAHIVGVLLAAPWGLQAVAAVSFFSSLLMVALCQVQLKAAIGLGWVAWLRPCLSSASLAACSVAAMAAAAWALRSAAAPAIAVLAGSVCAGLLAWWLSAGLLNHPARSEIAAVWQRWRLRRAPA
jgi:O-antigen/teichoic acid export membrane protein